MLSACGGTGTAPQKPAGGFQPSQIAKTDVDRVAETHQREIFSNLKILTEKLYRRNPREWRKGGSASIEAALDHAFEPRMDLSFPELGGARGADAILLALKPEYGGDRVFAFGVGLASMVLLSYNGKTEFYLTDTLDAQKLYNAARNVEIAVWKLENARDAHGDLLLLTNEMTGVSNLSFEREFGKIIAYQDAMAQIAAQRTNRTIRRAVQTLATAVFLPI